MTDKSYQGRCGSERAGVSFGQERVSGGVLHATRSQRPEKSTKDRKQRESVSKSRIQRREFIRANGAIIKFLNFPRYHIPQRNAYLILYFTPERDTLSSRGHYGVDSSELQPSADRSALSRQNQSKGFDAPLDGAGASNGL